MISVTCTVNLLTLSNIQAPFNHPLMFKHSYKAIIHLLYIERLTINLVLLAFQRNSSATLAHKHTWIVMP